MQLSHAALACTLALVVGCSATHAPEDGSRDAYAAPPPPTDQLDLVIVFDDSNYAWNSTQPLYSVLPGLLEALVSGDRDGDGTPELPPVRSMHVAVLSGDVGTGVGPIRGCRTTLGDDGLFQTAAARPNPSCPTDLAATAPHGVFVYDADADTDVAQLARDVLCIPFQPDLATRGCDYQAPLESALKAVSLTPTAEGGTPVAWTSPDYRPPSFLLGTTGHGDDPDTNASFLRADSVLAVLIASAIDDCASLDTSLYAAAATRSIRADCVFGDQLTAPQRYVDGFLGLRTRARRFVLLELVGVPIALSGGDPARILADPAMQPTPEALESSFAFDACNDPHFNYAAPAIRLTRVAEAIESAGGHVAVRSMCDDDFEHHQQQFFDEITAALAGR